MQRHALRHRLVAIDVGAHLRHVDLIAREQAREPRRLPAGADDLLRLLVERLVAQARAILDLQLEAADRAQALNRRRREDRDVRVLDRRELLIQRRPRSRSAERVFSKFGSSKSRSATNAMPTFGALTKPLTERPGERDRVRDAGLGQHDVRHAADDLLGPIERRGFGQLRERDEVLLVLLRDEAFAARS